MKCFFIGFWFKQQPGYNLKGINHFFIIPHPYMWTIQSILYSFIGDEYQFRFFYLIYNLAVANNILVTACNWATYIITSNFPFKNKQMKFILTRTVSQVTKKDTCHPVLLMISLVNSLYRYYIIPLYAHPQVIHAHPQVYCNCVKFHQYWFIHEGVVALTHLQRNMEE